jgi:predicted permease
MEVINTLLPVFFMIALGAILRRTRFISTGVVAGLNNIVFWVGLPCLLFYQIATAEYDFASAGKTFLVVFAGMLVCVAAGYIAAGFLRLPGPAMGAFVQGAFRGNLYYVGLAVLLYSLSDNGDADAIRIKNIAILVLALIIPVYNVAAVIVLLAGRQKLDRRVFGRLTRQVVTNPLIVSCAAGIIYQFFFSSLPVAVARALTSVGQVSLPLALIAVGAALVESKVGGYALCAFSASVIKIVIAPLAGLAGAIVLGLGPGETKVAMILLACPTAAVSYVMAEQLGSDEKLSAAIVTISTVLSIISLSVVVALF